MQEVTAGTAVAATALWRGVGTYEDGTTRRYPDEDVAYFTGVDRSYESHTIARLAMDETPLTFEQLPYILTAGVKEDDDGTADGGGSGYVYTYTFSTTSANDLQSFTLEAGDDNQAWEAAYCLVTDFEISGGGGADSDAVMMSANWIGREWNKTSFTGSSLASVSEAVFPKSKLYIDAIGGTLGSTQITSTFLDFTLSVETGVRAMFTGDGELYFTDAMLRAMPEITCEIGMLYNSDAQTEIDAWLAGTSKLVEIELVGPALGTSDTYSNKTVRIQLPGSWETFSGLEDVEGGDRVTGTFRSRYNSTAGSGPQIIVVNELANLV